MAHDFSLTKILRFVPAPVAFARPTVNKLSTSARWAPTKRTPRFALEDKYDDIKKLIDTGKRNGKDIDLWDQFKDLPQVCTRQKTYDLTYLQLVRKV